MSPRLRAAVVELLEAIEAEDQARAENDTKPVTVDEVARAKARRAMQRHGLRKVAKR